MENRISSKQLKDELERVTSSTVEPSIDALKAIALAAISELEKWETSEEEPPFFGPNGHYGWYGK